MNRYGVDLESVLRKQYYAFFGFIALAILCLLYAYYLSEFGNIKPIQANVSEILFKWIFPALAVIEAGLAIYFRKKKFFSPMVKSKETFANDFEELAFTNSLIYLSMFGMIAIYGLITVLIGGKYLQAFYYIIPAIGLILIFRPNHYFLEKSLSVQQQLADEGKFYKP